MLPVWDVLQKALALMRRLAERRVHVVRVLTTGEALHPVCACSAGCAPALSAGHA